MGVVVDEEEPVCGEVSSGGTTIRDTFPKTTVCPATADRNTPLYSLLSTLVRVMYLVVVVTGGGGGMVDGRCPNIEANESEVSPPPELFSPSLSLPPFTGLRVLLLLLSPPSMLLGGSVLTDRTASSGGGVDG